MTPQELKKLARINRGEAVILANGVLNDPEVYKRLTPLGIARLAQAVLKMDAALLKIANDARCIE